MSRRELIRILSIGGVGATALAYQNCSNMKGTAFGSNSSASLSCDFDIYNDSASLLSKPDGLVAGAGEHDLNAAFYYANYFDQLTQVQRRQYLIAVDVGTYPGGGQFHPISNSNTASPNIISDIYVFLDRDGSLLLRKRFGAADDTPSALFLIDEALVAAKEKVTVVAHCLMHGYFAQSLDLGQSAQNYSMAVTPFIAGTLFGGSSLRRPYVAYEATGGQGNVGVLHAPDFVVVNATNVQVTLGAPASKHGRFAENHYVAGGVLYDENGNIIALASELTYAQAANHLLNFTGFDLAARPVKTLRVAVLDTYNGIMTGFYRLD